MSKVYNVLHVVLREHVWSSEDEAKPVEEVRKKPDHWTKQEDRSAKVPMYVERAAKRLLLGSRSPEAT